jgi:DNA repair photolyase
MSRNYQDRQAKSILTPTGGYLNNFTHTLNPYEGCAFGAQTSGGTGCPFCYVRELPIAKFAGQPWGDWVRAKINAPDLLQQDIARYQRKHPARGLRIFMSSSTDPYQGLEAKLQLSRKILTNLIDYLPTLELLIVQTRSPLVERDLDLFSHFGQKIWLSLSLETDDEAVRKQITPTSPSVSRRLATLEKFYQANIQTQAAISPLLPCNAARFAELLKDRCHRVLLDTFHNGDGSGGRRSEKLGVFELLRQLGYHDWITADCHQPVYQALIETLGSERVAFSQFGFNNFS